MLGGGAELSWLEPLDADGNRTDLPIEERVVGDHIGPYSGLNLVDPQPGFEYIWMLNPTRPNPNPADGLAIHVAGGQVVREEDPEFAAYQKMEGTQNAPLDTSTVYGGELVLVRIPVERMDQRRRENLEKNARMLRKGPEESFVAQASHLEGERYSGRGPTRFAVRGHQTEFNHDREAVEVSLPDSGIVRTENID